MSYEKINLYLISIAPIVSIPFIVTSCGGSNNTNSNKLPNTAPSNSTSENDETTPLSSNNNSEVKFIDSKVIGGDGTIKLTNNSLNSTIKWSLTNQNQYSNLESIYPKFVFEQNTTTTIANNINYVRKYALVKKDQKAKFNTSFINSNTNYISNKLTYTNKYIGLSKYNDSDINEYTTSYADLGWLVDSAIRDMALKTTEYYITSFDCTIDTNYNYSAITNVQFGSIFKITVNLSSGNTNNDETDDDSTLPGSNNNTNDNTIIDSDTIINYETLINNNINNILEYINTITTIDINWISDLIINNMITNSYGSVLEYIINVLDLDIYNHINKSIIDSDTIINYETLITNNINNILEYINTITTIDINWISDLIINNMITNSYGSVLEYIINVLDLDIYNHINKIILTSMILIL